jgi:hypothetical protein
LEAGVVGEDVKGEPTCAAPAHGSREGEGNTEDEYDMDADCEAVELWLELCVMEGVALWLRVCVRV